MTNTNATTPALPQAHWINSNDPTFRRAWDFLHRRSDLLSLDDLDGIGSGAGYVEPDDVITLAEAIDNSGEFPHFSYTVGHEGTCGVGGFQFGVTTVNAPSMSLEQWHSIDNFGAAWSDDPNGILAALSYIVVIMNAYDSALITATKAGLMG